MADRSYALMIATCAAESHSVRWSWGSGDIAIFVGLDFPASMWSWAAAVGRIGNSAFLHTQFPSTLTSGWRLLGRLEGLKFPGNSSFRIHIPVSLEIYTSDSHERAFVFPDFF